METWRKIFIEPNIINVLIWQTTQMRIQYSIGLISVEVGMQQVYKRVKSIPLWSQKDHNSYGAAARGLV